MEQRHRRWRLILLFIVQSPPHPLKKTSTLAMSGGHQTAPQSAEITVVDEEDGHNGSL